MGAEVHINFRPEQLALYTERKRFAVRVVHRRFGKTWLAIAELVADALQTQRKDFRGYFLAPTYTQAKRISWDYIKQFTRDLPGIAFNEAELRVDFGNGARIQLLGGENYDSLRGQYADAVVMDECQLIPSVAWSQVIRPMLADRNGHAVLQGTPSGRMNLLHEQFEYAKNSGDPDWSAHLMTVNDTDVLDPVEVAAMKREMSEAEYNQELLCDWSAAVKGAYFSKEMAKAEAEGRITEVRYDANALVYAALDLGWSDLMVVHFVQSVGTEHHFIETRAYSQTKIADMIHDWSSLPFPVEQCVLPHDGVQHELTSGTTRQQTFESLGCETVIAPRVKSKHEGIEQTRALLSNSWFDRENCKITIEALLGYRADYDEVKRVVKMTPVHSWESHYVDAVQTYATGRPSVTHWGPLHDHLSPHLRTRSTGRLQATWDS